jgi:hypothetical protein
MPRGFSDYDSAVIQGRLWTPDVLRPDAWLDVSDLSTIQYATGISQITDKSGRGNNVTQSTTGYQPTLLTNRLNGLPVAKFDGTDDALSFASGFMNAWTEVSFVWVMFGTGGSNNGNFGPATFSTGLELIYANVISKPTLFRINNSERVGSGLYSTSETSPTISSIAADASSTGAWNGGAAVSMTSSAGIAALNYNGVYNIGKYNGVSGFAANMAFGEWLIFNSFLSQRDRQMTEGYLSWKWGIRLAADHPYANRPPLIGD